LTCAATNIPLLHQKAKIVFADIQPATLNLAPDHLKTLVTARTKAIVCVHYGGLPCDMEEIHAIARPLGIPVIEDAAHALGATYQGKRIGQISDFTCFSFQAIKHLTTGDGGMLVLSEPSLRGKAARLRWFGIDREAKIAGRWDNNISEVGYKYQMTDIAASMGLAGLEEFDATLAHRQALLSSYRRGLRNIAGLTTVGMDMNDREHAAWICTVLVERRQDLQRKLQEAGIESDPVHYRNDRYDIFGGRRTGLDAMDAVEQRYLVLPLHTKVDRADVERICGIIRSGW
jgi:dTDP-4-amino-4,6-dideoxygalactose transaminase